MSTRGRFTFACWNCTKSYTLFREISDEQVLTVACPFCHADGVVELAQHRKPKPKTVMRGSGDDTAAPGEELVLPPILPTQKPD